MAASTSHQLLRNTVRLFYQSFPRCEQTGQVQVQTASPLKADKVGQYLGTVEKLLQADSRSSDWEALRMMSTIFDFPLSEPLTRDLDQLVFVSRYHNEKAAMPAWVSGVNQRDIVTAKLLNRRHPWVRHVDLSAWSGTGTASHRLSEAKSQQPLPPVPQAALGEETDGSAVDKKRFYVKLDAQAPKWKTAVWRGDITTLAVDGIVNAANEQQLGCFRVGHRCIDNVIQEQAGPRLRLELLRQMEARQWRSSPAGSTEVLTPAFCLPARYILHTVGPRCLDGVARPSQLAGCYATTLELAKEYSLRSVALCSVSTGVFGYPKEQACLTALQTVHDWLQDPANLAAVDMVLFNVFSDEDLQLYLTHFPAVFSS